MRLFKINELSDYFISEVQECIYSGSFVIKTHCIVLLQFRICSIAQKYFIKVWSSFSLLLLMRERKKVREFVWFRLYVILGCYPTNV